MKDTQPLEALFLCALGRGPMLDQNMALRLLRWVDPYVHYGPEDQAFFRLLDLYDEAYDKLLEYEEIKPGLELDEN